MKLKIIYIALLFLLSFLNWGCMEASGDLVGDGDGDGGTSGIIGGIGGGGNQSSSSGNSSSSINPDSIVFNTKIEYKFHSENLIVDQGLLVYLHHEGAEDFTDLTFDSLKSIGKKYGLAILMPLAPDSIINEFPNEVSGNYVRSWSAGIYQNSDSLAKLIDDEVMGTVNIDPKRIYFIASSLSSDFLTEYFLPAKSRNYGGGAFLLCGGTLNNSGQFYSPGFKNNFFFEFYISKYDRLYDDVWSSITELKTQGFDVGENYLLNNGHCNFNSLDVAKDLMESKITIQ